MKRILLILISLSLALGACVGVHEEDDPEPPVPVIDPEDGSADAGTRFFHRCLALEFTATWCQYCPNMADALESAQRERPGRLVEVAVHYSDALAAPESGALVKRFSVTTFPTMVLDLDPATKFQRHDPQPMIAHVDAVSGQAVGGLAVDASVAGTVRVRVKAVSEGRYRVAVALVRDGTVTEQAGYGPGYVNRAVLQSFISPDEGYSLGLMRAEEERTADFQAPEAASGLRVAAWLIRETEAGLRAENAAQCAIGKKIDYRYEVD